MAGPPRLPGGERRKASQRHIRGAGPPTALIGPSWRAGDKVRWQHYSGIFRRDLGDGEHADIIVAHRVYRVRTVDLKAAAH